MTCFAATAFARPLFPETSTALYRPSIRVDPLTVPAKILRRTVAIYLVFQAVLISVAVPSLPLPGSGDLVLRDEFKCDDGYLSKR